MTFIKNVRLEPASGGYIITCDKHQKVDNNEYDGLRFIGQNKTVVEDGEDAIKILDFLFSVSIEGSEIELEGGGDLYPSGGGSPKRLDDGNASRGTNLLTHE